MCNKQELGQSTALGLVKQAFPRYTNQQEWLRILHCSHLPQPSPKILTQRKASPCTLCFRQVSEAITSGETAKPSWILMWKEKSESYPACLMLKKTKAVEQATSERKWAIHERWNCCYSSVLQWFPWKGSDFTPTVDSVNILYSLGKRKCSCSWWHLQSFLQHTAWHISSSTQSIIYNKHA